MRKKQEEKATIEQWRLTFEVFKQLNEKSLPSRMVVSTQEGVHIIPIDEIIRLQAYKNSTEIIFQGAAKRVIASVHLGAYEEQFEPYRQFMRVHRGHLVNLTKVKKFVKSDSKLEMCDGSTAKVARAKHESLIQRLGEL